jgi:hypothetical protein
MDTGFYGEALHFSGLLGFWLANEKGREFGRGPWVKDCARNLEHQIRRCAHATRAATGYQ